MAFVLRGSKIAAAAATWVSNPATIPFLYFESYKAGTYLLGISATCCHEYNSMPELLKQGLDVAFAALLGGIVLGIPGGGGIVLGIPGGIFAYFITRIVMANISSGKKSAGPEISH